MLKRDRQADTAASPVSIPSPGSDRPTQWLTRALHRRHGDHFVTARRRKPQRGLIGYPAIEDTGTFVGRTQFVHTPDG